MRTKLWFRLFEVITGGMKAWSILYRSHLHLGPFEIEPCNIETMKVHSSLLILNH